MVFDDNGPNLPAQPWEEQKWNITDGKSSLQIIINIFQGFHYWSNNCHHTLIHNGKETP